MDRHFAHCQGCIKSQNPKIEEKSAPRENKMWAKCANCQWHIKWPPDMALTVSPRLWLPPIPLAFNAHHSDADADVLRSPAGPDATDATGLWQGKVGENCLITTRWPLSDTSKCTRCQQGPFFAAIDLRLIKMLKLHLHLPVDLIGR